MWMQAPEVARCLVGREIHKLRENSSSRVWLRKPVAPGGSDPCCVRVGLLKS